MNHESPEASSQQPTETSAFHMTQQPANSAERPAASRHDPSQPEGTAVEGSPPPVAASDVADHPVASPVEMTQSGWPAPADEPAAKVEAPKAAPLRHKMQIGARKPLAVERSSAPPASRPAPKPVPKPIVTETAEEPVRAAVPPPAASTPVPTPSVRDPLSPDLERELAAALGDASLDDILVGEIGAESATLLELESRHQASVTRIHGDNVFFALGGRNEGVASLRMFPEPPILGSSLEVIVKSYVSEEGLYELVIPGASMQVEDWSDLVQGAIVEARITGANTGGLECKVGSIRGFIPASQIAIFRVEDYAEFLDQKLLCMVTEVNPKRKNLVLSRRAILEREKEVARQEMLQNLREGQVVDGVVRKLMDFGAFVDVGGLDGLVHVSKLSWDHVSHPSEVLHEGQKIRVRIEKVDTQSGKIGLSVRDLLDHPWTNIEEKFPVNAVVSGTVSRIAKFGAFVKLAAGIEGLVHISELSHGRVPSVSSVVSEGQQVEVKVLSIDSAAQRIALSMKAAMPEPEPEEESQVAADQSEPPREPLAVKRSSKPLKGGVGRDSGGERFGLKW